MSVKLKFKKLVADAIMPSYATDGSAGMDIRAIEDVKIPSGSTGLVGTGLAVAIPSGYVGLIFPRSGLSLRSKLRQSNCVGVIDSDYRGEFKGMFDNTGTGDIVIKKGDRFAQMVIVPYETCEIEESANLDETDRGVGGFGSTGV